MTSCPQAERKNWLIHYGRPILCNFYLMTISALLTSCSAGHLTEKECLTIQEKEIAQISSWSSSTRDHEWVSERKRHIVAACVAGERYTREDYMCFISANTNEEIGRCICLESASAESAKERERCKT